MKASELPKIRTRSIQQMTRISYLKKNFTPQSAQNLAETFSRGALFYLPDSSFSVLREGAYILPADTPISTIGYPPDGFESGIVLFESAKTLFDDCIPLSCVAIPGATNSEIIVAAKDLTTKCIGFFYNWIDGYKEDENCPLSVGFLWDLDSEAGSIFAPPTDFEDDPEFVPGLNKFFARHYACLASLAATPTACTVEHAQVSRADQRSSKRAGHSSEVRVIKMRPEVCTHDTMPTTSSRTEWMFYHSWTVKGFWRMQPCGPRNSLRRPTYVTEHIRGNASQVLLNTETVRKI